MVNSQAASVSLVRALRELDLEGSQIMQSEGGPAEPGGDMEPSERRQMHDEDASPARHRASATKPEDRTDGADRRWTMNDTDRELLGALADAVERLLLAHAVDVADVERDPRAVVMRRTQRLGAEESTRLLDRIQALRRARPAGD